MTKRGVICCVTALPPPPPTGHFRSLARLLSSSPLSFATLDCPAMMGGAAAARWIRRLSAARISTEALQRGQSRVIDASLTLIRERAKLKGELIRAMGDVKASASLLGVPLGHNSSFLQGPAFAPPRIREAIWCGSTNSSTEEGKELNDPRVLTDVGDVPIQEIRDCGVEDERLMHVISESVKTVMEEDPLRPLVLGGDHSISYPVVRAVSEKLGGPVDILHFDAHPDIYDCFEGNTYSHASSFARIMEGGYARRLLQLQDILKGFTTWGLLKELFFPCQLVLDLDQLLKKDANKERDLVWNSMRCVPSLEIERCLRI
ncbi:unnamed protein product [Alopecurus aequalis]